MDSNTSRNRTAHDYRMEYERQLVRLSWLVKKAAVEAAALGFEGDEEDLFQVSVHLERMANIHARGQVGRTFRAPPQRPTGPMLRLPL